MTMNNGRDCDHGRQLGKCDTCDLEEAQADNERLLRALQMVNDLLDHGAIDEARAVITNVRTARGN